jgi:hypothetical protein
MEKEGSRHVWECGLINSMIETIWKNRTQIISACEQKGWRRKQFRKPERYDIDVTLLKWFKQ